MDILAELQEYINEFNLNNEEEFSIDSIRINFNKSSKKVNLEKLGDWKKIHSKDNRIMAKLKKRLDANQITSAVQLENYPIYYFNTNEDAPQYRKAVMVIFGLNQYHKDPPPKELVNSIISILKNITNIDLCLDLDFKPNIDALNRKFILKQYFDTKIKVDTDTYYINAPNILMIDKITIYNKQTKNNLGFKCWRIEALIQIPNIKVLALPLHEFMEVVNIARLGNIRN